MIRIGTSGWNYPTGRGTWNGVFYPARRARGFDELAYYAERFETVEVNSTFYRMPEAGMTRRWLDRTPASFLFSVKLFQKFTHPDRYLERAGASDWDLSRADVDLFRAGVDPIVSAGRLGAMLVQFPPSFHESPDTLGYVDWLLGAFADLPAAVELRHRSWSDARDRTDACLASRGAAWVVIDEPKFSMSIRQSVPGTFALPAGGPNGLAYVRLHGRNAARWWDHDEAEDRYDYLYSKEELAPFADDARAASHAGRRVLVYFNNHFSAKAVANAAVLKHDLGQANAGTYSREMLNRYPDLRDVVVTDGLPL